MKNTITILTTLVFALGAQAANVRIDTLRKEESLLNVAQVQAAFTLKKSTIASPTRINLVVKDLGGSTDVSPGLGLYLVFWQDGEMGDSTAAFEIANTFGLIDFKLLPGNKLELKLKTYNNEVPGMVTTTEIVDFSEFAKKFETSAQGEGEEFETNWVKGSVYSQQ